MTADLSGIPTQIREHIEHSLERIPIEDTFETFIPGNNQKAVSYTKGAAEKNGDPLYHQSLFIHGARGVGKTHLLGAVGNRCKQGNTVRVLYEQSKRFAHYGRYLGDDSSPKQISKFIELIDVLLLDNFQGNYQADGAAEEFLSIAIETLIAQDKLVIITSRLTPQKITHPVKILLPITVTPPDETTRIKILQTKATELGRHVPLEAIIAIAQKATTDVRELERALRRLLIYIDDHGEPQVDDWLGFLYDEGVLKEGEPLIPGRSPLTRDEIVAALEAVYTNPKRKSGPKPVRVKRIQRAFEANGYEEVPIDALAAEFPEADNPTKSAAGAIGWLNEMFAVLEIDIEIRRRSCYVFTRPSDPE